VNRGNIVFCEGKDCILEAAYAEVSRSEGLCWFNFGEGLKISLWNVILNEEGWIKDFRKKSTGTS
jgi:hypothetical protein